MAERDDLIRRRDDVVDATDTDYATSGSVTDPNMTTTDMMDDEESHASTGGAMLAGAATGGVIGLVGGPVGAAVGAVGGAIVGAVTERVMHSGDDMDNDTMLADTDTSVDTINPPLRSSTTHDTPYDEDTIGASASAADSDVVDTAPGRVMRGDMTVDRQFTGSDADTLELREEQLSARKDRVQAGQVEVGKRVVEEQRTIEVPVTREEVVIERRPVNRAATETDFVGNDSETIRVPVMEEDVTVEKRPMVTEEISVGKQIRQDTQRVSDTVRREEAVVNRSGDVNVGGDTQAFDAYAPSYQSYWNSRYGTSGEAWSDYEPTYRFGHDSFYDARYRGRGWNDVETDMHRDYASRYGESAWQKAKDTLHDAWDNLFGRDSR